MKTTIIAAACALALSAGVAAAQQSSQGDAGPGTINNRAIGTTGGNMGNNSNMGRGAGMTNGTTGSGMSNPNMAPTTAMNPDGTARNPSSQGNAGPGTDNNNPRPGTR